MYVKILLILLLNLFACNVNAIKKPTKKQLALWEQIENSAKQNNMQKMISLCRTLVGCSEMYDSLACLSRALLAEYSMTSSNLYEVYDSYVFFREYSKQKKHMEKAKYYRDALSEHYKKLLIEDLNDRNYDGLWFSDIQGDNNEPFIAFRLNANGQEKPDIVIWEGCKLYKELSKYGSKDTNGISNPSLIMENENGSELRFLAQWGDQRIRDPKTNTAVAMKGIQNMIKADTDAALETAPAGHFEEKLAIQAASVGLQVLFGVFSDLLSVGKVKSYAMALNFGEVYKGIMHAVIEIESQIVKTGQTPQKTKNRYKMNLYKWYPHNEITFTNNSKFFDQFRLSEKMNKDEQSYYNKVSPFVYEDGNKNNRKKTYNSKKFNNQMYLDFACDRIFDRMYKDTISAYVSKRDEMRYLTNYNEGSVFLFGWDKKTERQKDFRAERLYDGTTFFYQLNDSRVDGLRSGYYANGEHHVCKVYEGVKQGKYLIYDYNEGLLGYNFYADGKKEGKSRWRVEGGWLEIQWNSDEMKGLPVIYFDNGDEYTGNIENQKPNGKGTMKYANGNVVSGNWIDGVIEHQKSSTKNGAKRRGVKKKKKY